MWCSGVVGAWSQHLPKKKIITYLRRFELWSDAMMSQIDFNYVDSMIWINTYYGEVFNRLIDAENIKHYLIPNGIDLTEWKLREHTGDQNKIALIASMKHVKNIPLAAQILCNLPERYHIHHIGLHTDNYTGELFAYIEGLGLKDRWHWEPSVARENVQDWLQDKGCLLNPSVNEGNPNCVIEAMAMGIKPVIHTWPGAYNQFPENNIFKTVQEACEIIQSPQYDSIMYREWTEKNFSIDNFKMLHTVIADAL